MGVTRFILYSDSQLVFQQSNKIFEVKNDKMIKYAQDLNWAREALIKLIIQYISWVNNWKSDQLATMANTLAQLPSSKITGQELVSQIEQTKDVSM